MKRILALLLALCLLTLAGCGEKESEPETKGENWLTCVFRGEELALPGGASVRSDEVHPYCDPETGEVKLLAQTEAPFGYALAALDRDGNATLEPLSLSTELSLSCGCVTEDALYFVAYQVNPNTQLYEPSVGRYDFAAGETVLPLHELPESDGNPMSSVVDLTAGAERCFLASTREVIPMEDGASPLSLPVGNYIKSLTLAEDGTLWVVADNGGSVLLPLSPGAKEFGEPVYLEAEVKRVFFAEGYDLCFSSTDGLFGLDFAEAAEEEPRITPILSYENSALDGMYTRIFALPDCENVLLSVTDASTHERTFLRYHHAEDIDLSTVTTLEVVYGTEQVMYQTNVTSVITKFNREHPDIRVKLKDSTAGGEDALLRGIGLGEETADIVLCMTRSTLTSSLREQGLFTDLAPYLSADEALRDDLFGCVKGYCSTEDGRMWGLMPTILPRLLVGRADVLGNRESWSLSELLDLAESVPEGAKLADLPAASFADLLGSGGWACFLDREAGTCSFDSPEFLRLLRFRDSLVEPYIPLDQEQQIALYQSGAYLLYPLSIAHEVAFLRNRMRFGTDELCYIGYPSANGCGIEPSRTLCYVVPSTAQHPGEAWEFLKALLMAGVDHNMMDGFSALKSLYDKFAEEAGRREYTIYTDGSSSSHPYAEKATDSRLLEKNGVIDYFDPEDAAELKAILDRTAAPAANDVPEEIAAIIAEELSSYEGGAHTAEECAELIQSRVSLWLGEHK